jgi:hypothetical protein
MLAKGIKACVCDGNEGYCRRTWNATLSLRKSRRHCSSATVMSASTFRWRLHCDGSATEESLTASWKQVQVRTYSSVKVAARSTAVTAGPLSSLILPESAIEVLCRKALAVRRVLVQCSMQPLMLLVDTACQSIVSSINCHRLTPCEHGPESTAAHKLEAASIDGASASACVPVSESGGFCAHSLTTAVVFVPSGSMDSLENRYTAACCAVKPRVKIRKSAYCPAQLFGGSIALALISSGPPLGHVQVGPHDPLRTVPAQPSVLARCRLVCHHAPGTEIPCAQPSFSL